MLECKRIGSGIPVVYLHGFLESSFVWNQLTIQGIEKITIDLPEHGKSKHINALSMLSMAQEVFETLNTLNLVHYDIVGHSMGGYVALELAKLDTRCNRVVLLNSNFWEDSPQKKTDRKRVVELVKSHKDHFIIEAIPNLFLDPQTLDPIVADLITEAKDLSAENIGNATRAIMNREDNSELARSLGDKLLIIQGKYDQIVSLDMMRERISGMSCKVCELESAHMSVFESPLETQKCLLEFLLKENGN